MPYDEVNLYLYCRNNPVNVTDPSGLAPPGPPPKIEAITIGQRLDIEKSEKLTGFRKLLTKLGVNPDSERVRKAKVIIVTRKENVLVEGRPEEAVVGYMLFHTRFSSEKGKNVIQVIRGHTTFTVKKMAQAGVPFQRIEGFQGGEKHTLPDTQLIFGWLVETEQGPQTKVAYRRSLAYLYGSFLNEPINKAVLYFDKKYNPAPEFAALVAIGIAAGQQGRALLPLPFLATSRKFEAEVRNVLPTSHIGGYSFDFSFDKDGNAQFSSVNLPISEKDVLKINQVK
jgi:hypothetical protein